MRIQNRHALIMELNRAHDAMRASARVLSDSSVVAPCCTITYVNHDGCYVTDIHVVSFLLVECSKHGQERLREINKGTTHDTRTYEQRDIHTLAIYIYIYINTCIHVCASLDPKLVARNMGVNSGGQLLWFELAEIQNRSGEIWGSTLGVNSASRPPELFRVICRQGVIY